MLRHAGIRGFLQDTEKLYEDADAEGQELREFVTAWGQTHGAVWVACGDLLKLPLERDLLCQVVGDKSERLQLIRLGRALSSVRERQFGNLRICAGRNTDTKTAQYRQIRVGAEPAPMPAAPADIRGKTAPAKLAMSDSARPAATSRTAMARWTWRTRASRAAGPLQLNSFS